MTKTSRGSRYERSHSVDNVDAPQSRSYDNFYHSGCFRFAEDAVVSGWHAHQGMGEWWSHHDAGGWEKCDPASTSVQGESLENSQFWNNFVTKGAGEFMSEYDKEEYAKYRNASRAGRVKEATDEQRAASAKMSRLLLNDKPQKRIEQNNRVKDMNQKATTAREYLETVGIYMTSRWKNPETGKTETYQTIKKVYEKAVAKGYQKDIATLQRRSQRYAENPTSYQDSDVE